MSASIATDIHVMNATTHHGPRESFRLRRLDVLAVVRLQIRHALVLRQALVMLLRHFVGALLGSLVIGWSNEETARHQ